MNFIVNMSTCAVHAEKLNSAQKRRISKNTKSKYEYMQMSSVCSMCLFGPNSGLFAAAGHSFGSYQE